MSDTEVKNLMTPNSALKEAFVAALHEAGWQAIADAQHTRIDAVIEKFLLGGAVPALLLTNLHDVLDGLEELARGLKWQIESRPAQTDCSDHEALERALLQLKYFGRDKVF